MSSETDKLSIKRIKKFNTMLIVGCTVIITAAIAIISALSVITADRVIKDEIRTLTSALTVQINANVSSYFSRMENVCSVILTDPNIASYAPQNTGIGEASKTETDIADRLRTLSAMCSFSDLGIVYNNGITVGNISQNTFNMFNGKVYDTLSDRLKNSHTNWFTGYNSDYSQICHAVRINDNSILFCSFETSNADFEEIFILPPELEEVTVRLVGNDSTVIYSTDRNEISSPLRNDISISFGKTGTFMTDQYLISSEQCSDNRYVICSAPLNEILREKNAAAALIIAAGAIAVILSVLFASFITRKMWEPMKSYVTNLDTKAHTDPVTQLLNKTAFEEAAAEALSNAAGGTKFGLIFIEVDDLKRVNSQSGAAEGDRLLGRAGKFFKNAFDENDIIGRIEGGKFAVLCKIPEKSGGGAAGYVGAKCSGLCKNFYDEANRASTISAGASIFPEHAEYYLPLCSFADNALETAKQNGGSGYAIYSKTGSTNPNSNPDFF